MRPPRFLAFAPFIAPVCLAALALHLSPRALAGESDAAGEGNTEPVLVAHRGAMHALPENTLAAFERAIELGAAVLEVDVRLTRDGRLLVVHDATLDRSTDGTGKVSERSWDEIRQLDAGSWFDPAHAGLRVPELKEVLTLAKGRTTVLLDLKEKGPDFARAVSEEVRRHGDPGETVIGVRSPEQAAEFRETLTESRQLAFMRSPELIPEFAEAGVDFMRLWLRWVEADPDLPEQVRATGAKLMVNGKDGDLEEARQLLAARPDWILIDDLETLRASLDEIRGSTGSP